jgi:hypothetical protein
VVLIAFLPGALYIWSYERIVGRWGVGLADRLLRFFGASVVLQAVAAVATYRIWHDYLREGALHPNETLPLWLWPVTLAYVAAPIALGTIVGRATRQGRDWARLFTGASPAPTAWDALFSGEPRGWVLLCLKSGRWVGGEYGEDSYAAGYPEPADLFLSAEAVVDQAKEDFVRGDDGEPIKLRWGLLVRWDEVEYLEVYPVGGFR